MNDERFEKLMVELKDKSIYWLLGYFNDDIMRGLMSDPFLECTEEQADAITRIILLAVNMRE